MPDVEWFEQSFDPWTGEVTEVVRKIEDKPLSTKKCAPCGMQVIKASALDKAQTPTLMALDPTPTPDGAWMVMVHGATKSVRPVRDEDRTPAMRFYNEHRCSGFKEKT